MLRAPERLVLPPAERDDSGQPVRARWDPRLAASPELRRELIARLAKVGLITYRRRVQSRV
eukprot:7235098-Lingulodinium_polyedra.AAC.1